QGTICGTILGCAVAFAPLASSVTTLLGALGALYWFLFTRSFKRRIQFDVDLQIIDIVDEKFYAGEVALIVENKGQREHRLYNLLVEARESTVLNNGTKTAHYLVPQNI